MNALLALLLKDRISQFAYVDRLAGMVRAVSREQAGGTITIPVAIAVDDPLACDDSSVRDMVPDERYSCMVYFEDRGLRAIQTRTRGSNYESRLRLVCWVNTAKLNGDPYAGDRILRLFLSVFPTGVYNDGPFIGLRHVVEAVPERGRSLFSAYTYPDAARQYLLYPFDAFAIDVMTTLRIRPGCEDQVTAADAACWAPPANRRRRNPSEFSCDELNAPITGLSDAQKECIDGCGGGGPCPPTTVNGVQSDTPAITVMQGGVEVGVLNPVTGVHTVAECPPTDPCDPLTATLEGVEIINEADPCGAAITLNCSDPVNLLLISGGTIYDGTYYPIWDEADQHWHYYLDGDVNAYAMVMRGVWSIGAYTADPPGTEQWPWEAVFSGLPDMVLTQGTIGDICGGVAPACDPLEITVNGVAFSEVSDPCGGSRDVAVVDANDDPVGSLDAPLWRIPSAVIQLRDSSGNAIGSPDSYVPGTVADKTAPDGTVTINNSVPTLLHTVSVKSNGAATQAIADSTITKPDGTTVGLPATVALDVRDYRSGIAYQFGGTHWSGQSTSYRTGDEGDLYGTSWFSYAPPVYPTHYARLGANRTTLAANNIHGNTDRFTDRSGGQTYSDDIVQDHLTGIEWYRVLQTAATWNDAIDGAEALSVGGSTDWHLPPSRVIDIIANDAAGAGNSSLNFAPFSISNTNYWTGSTFGPTTTSAWRMTGQAFSSAAKTSTNPWIACRRFI